MLVRICLLLCLLTPMASAQSLPPGGDADQPLTTDGAGTVDWGEAVRLDGSPMIYRGTALEANDTFELLRFPVEYGDPGLPQLTEWRLGWSSTDSGGQWDRIDSVFNFLYNHDGVGAIQNDQQAFNWSWESDYSLPGATEGSWVENNLSVDPPGAPADWRPWAWRWNADKDVSWWALRNNNNNTVMRVSDQNGTYGIMVGNSHPAVGQSILATVDARAYLDETGGPSSRLVVKSRLWNESNTNALLSTFDTSIVSVPQDDSTSIGDLRSFNGDIFVDLGGYDNLSGAVRGIYLPITISNVATNTGIDINGLEIPIDVSDTADSVGPIRTLRGIYLRALPDAPPGTEAARAVYGIDIGDMGGQDDFPSRNSTIRISPQDNQNVPCNGASSCVRARMGNVSIEGFDFTDGHLQVGDSNGLRADHLWRDQSGEQWRSSTDGEPLHAGDGQPLVQHSTSSDHGVLAWATAGVSCSDACTSIKADGCLDAGVFELPSTASSSLRRDRRVPRLRLPLTGKTPAARAPGRGEGRLRCSRRDGQSPAPPRMKATKAAVDAAVRRPSGLRCIGRRRVAMSNSRTTVASLRSNPPATTSRRPGARTSGRLSLRAAFSLRTDPAQPASHSRPRSGWR